MPRPLVYILVPKGTIVLGAYTGEAAARLHERCVEGTGVVGCELLEQVPPEIREDLLREWESESDTPVTPMRDENTPTKPLTLPTSERPTIRTRPPRPRKEK